MKKLFVIVIILGIVTINAQTNKKQKDITAIKSMSGCYQVGFNFSETFNYSKDENYKSSAVKHDKALEWVEILTDKKNKIQLQHLLIVGPKDKPHIVKHWRQDWLFENQDLFLFNKSNSWKYSEYSKEQVKGNGRKKYFK